eukprot:5755000-Pyramimonas_sp.AAC.1
MSHSSAHFKAIAIFPPALLKAAKLPPFCLVPSTGAFDASLDRSMTFLPLWLRDLFVGRTSASTVAFATWICLVD